MKKLSRSGCKTAIARNRLYTLWHWKASMLYHETKDPHYVKQFLGHKSLMSTEVYINIERAVFESTNDSFTVKTAQTPEEIQQPL